MGKQIDIKIFATDIDRNAITRASSGIYPESIAVDLPPGLLAKYFHRKEDHYRIDRSIREMVVFAQHNLIKDPPFTNIELVSCRNLLIYLQPVLQRKALDLINFSLNAQGVLLPAAVRQRASSPIASIRSIRNSASTQPKVNGGRWWVTIPSLLAFLRSCLGKIARALPSGVGATRKRNECSIVFCKSWLAITFPWLW